MGHAKDAHLRELHNYSVLDARFMSSASPGKSITSGFASEVTVVAAKKIAASLKIRKSKEKVAQRA
jgi:hypothetical protein